MPEPEKPQVEHYGGPMTTARTELQALVETLSDEDAAELLDYTHWLLAEDDDELTPEELARAEEGQRQIEQGRYITLEELRERLGR